MYTSAAKLLYAQVTKCSVQLNSLYMISLGNCASAVVLQASIAFALTSIHMYTLYTYDCTDVHLYNLNTTNKAPFDGFGSTFYLL